MTARWTGAGRLDPAWHDGLLGPGKMFELVDEDVLGTVVPVFAQRPRSLWAVLEQAAGSHADRPYLAGPERTVTFADAPDAAARVAAVLRDGHGVRAGDRVALAGGVSVDHVLALWAAIHLGAVAATMNPAWTDAELEAACRLADPALLLVDDPVAERLHAAGWTGAPVVTFTELAAEVAAAGEVDPPAPEPVAEDDPLAIIFTSGTTGTPKGATLSHRNAIQFSLAAACTTAVHNIVNEISSNRGLPSAVIASSPLFHVSGLLGQVGNAAFWGTTLVIAPLGRWDATTHLALTEEHRVTQWSLVPTQLWRLIDHPELDRFDLSSLENIGGGGATFEPELLRRTAERLPGAALALRVGYGMTETAGTATLLAPPASDELLASVGPPVAGSEVRIVDAEGAEVPDGEVGEIQVRSAQVFLGYWANPDATAAVLSEDRWYSTGDFGRLEDGVLFLESRRRDLIIRGGENVYPIEIENRLVEHPAIAEAAVVGADHPTLGQEVRAVIVVRDGEEVTTDDVRAFVGETLARHKVPTIVDVVDELPRNATGKVLKAQLIDPPAAAAS